MILLPVNRCFSSENPCGHGQCLPTGNNEYTCDCEEDYTMHGGTCERKIFNIILYYHNLTDYGS